MYIYIIYSEEEEINCVGWKSYSVVVVPITVYANCWDGTSVQTSQLSLRLYVSHISIFDSFLVFFRASIFISFKFVSPMILKRIYFTFAKWNPRQLVELVVVTTTCHIYYVMVNLTLCSLIWTTYNQIPRMMTINSTLTVVIGLELYTIFLSHRWQCVITQMSCYLLRYLIL